MISFTVRVFSVDLAVAYLNDWMKCYEILYSYSWSPVDFCDPMTFPLAPFVFLKIDGAFY